MSTGTNPKCLVIAVCESVVEDTLTHNKCILNMFNALNAMQFPAAQPKLVVFVALTDGRGTVPVVLKFVEDNTESVLFQLNATISFKSPLDIADMVFNLLGLPLPRPGPYSVQIFANGAHIGERRIQVTQF